MTGGQNQFRIDGHPIDPHLKVQVNTDTVSGVSRHAQYGASHHPLARLKERLVTQVPVDRRQPLAVVDHDVVAVTTTGVTAREDDHAVAAGQYQTERVRRRDINAQRMPIAEQARDHPA